MHEFWHKSHVHPFGVSVFFLFAKIWCGSVINARKGETPLAAFLKKSLLGKFSFSI
jgi:hypothetical protein